MKIIDVLRAEFNISGDSILVKWDNAQEYEPISMHDLFNLFENLRDHINIGLSDLFEEHE